MLRQSLNARCGGLVTGAVAPVFLAALDGFRASVDSGANWVGLTIPPSSANLGLFSYSVSAAAKALASPQLTATWSFTAAAPGDYVLGFAGLGYTAVLGASPVARLTLTGLMGSGSFVAISAYADADNALYGTGTAFSTVTRSGTGTSDGAALATLPAVAPFSMYLRLRIRAFAAGTASGTASFV